RGVVRRLAADAETAAVAADPRAVREADGRVGAEGGGDHEADGADAAGVDRGTAGDAGPGGGGALEATTLKQLQDVALKFRDEREWKQFHNPKDLAVSLSIEAAELMELMQWKNGPELVAHLLKRKEDVGDELSDILHAVLLLAADLEVDLAKAF